MDRHDITEIWNIAESGVKHHKHIPNIKGPRWLNELGSWITKQLIQAYHQYGVGSRPAL
jgi:hypothetical protein